MTTLARRALILGPLTAVTPLSIDLYLPALPAIARELDASLGVVQLSLVAYMLSMAAGPLLWGPLSDRIGRRAAMTAGMAVYTLAALLLVIAPSIEAIIALRFLQGLGGSSAQVCARAAVRDNYSGMEAARLLSLMMLILGISPMLAPVIGALVLSWLPWRFTFVIFALLGLASLLIIRIPFRESLPPERRHSGSLGALLLLLGMLFRDAGFLSTVLIGAFAHAGFYTYLVNSSSVLMQSYGVTAVGFGVIFGCNALAMVIGSQLNVWLLPRLGPLRIARMAASVYALACLAMLAAAAIAPGNLLALQVPMLLAIACLGFINANTTAIGLEGQAHRAGSASSVISLLQIGIGVVAASLAGFIAEHSALAMSAVMLVCGSVSVVLALRLRAA